MNGLTLGVAVDLGPDGIRVILSPGGSNWSYVEFHPDRSLVERELAHSHPVGRSDPQRK
ncbi:MAG: hypothetical protein E5Y89_00180 [Mesorhizobium sp.]|nr:MAG: hypothetical protein E5Y89_00180 [Mesorhizobium sp.]